MPRNYSERYTAEDVLNRLRDWRVSRPDDPAERRLCARIKGFWLRTPQERVIIVRLTAKLANQMNGSGPLIAFEVVDAELRAKADKHNGRKT